MTAKGTATLTFAIRVKVVAWLLGQLLLPLAGLAIVPLAVALAFGETGFALRCAAIAAAVLVLGWLMSRIEAPTDVRPNEAMAGTALVFLIAAAAMTWPFAENGLAAIDAWFESVSAITTTGLTTLTHVEARSPAFLFTRAWMQWYGGLAIVVLAVALVLGPGIAARRLVVAEGEAADVIGRARTRARVALVVYVSLTAAAFALLVIAGAQPFDALVHGLAAVSTGGFSSYDNSLAGMGGAGIRIAASIMSFAGALSFTLYMRPRLGRWRDFVQDPDLRALLWAVLASTLLLWVFMTVVGGHGWLDALRQAPLIAVSAQTTTGFSTLNVGELDAASKLTLVASMFVGGDVGSTAGGIKITRFLVLLALVGLAISRTRLPPHAVAEPTISGRQLQETEVYGALTVVILHAAVIGASWLIFVANGYDGVNALFEVTSAVGTVGLSTGITSAGLAAGLKWLLAADMLMGRLEVVAFIVLLYPPNWFGGRAAEVS